MEGFSLLQQALFASDLSRKFEYVETLYKKSCEKGLSYDHDVPVLPQTEPSYSAFLTIVRPRDVPRRKRFDDDEGLGVLLHAIAHIEYSAIDLALDAAYRFRRMPVAYYHDWIEVAHDEVRHFRMLASLMEALGVRYGDYPVHDALFQAARKTAGDPLERMAVVPRYLEANGLDANPKIMEKLKRTRKDVHGMRTLEALETILREEVTHVAKGDRWFKYLCDRRGISPAIYFEIVERHYPDQAIRHPAMNVSARLQAGFACDELRRMGAAECEENGLQEGMSQDRHK